MAYLAIITRYSDEGITSGGIVQLGAYFMCFDPAASPVPGQVLHKAPIELDPAAPGTWNTVITDAVVAHGIENGCADLIAARVHLPVIQNKPAHRAGNASVSLGQSPLSVSFSTSMGTNNYSISTQQVTGVVTFGAVTARTATGFTIDIVVSTAGTVDWIAIPHN